MRDRAFLIKLRDDLNRQIAETPCCYNCEFSKSDGVDWVCDLAGRHVPAEVVDIGCEQFLPEIPF